jgi:beta-N-acetylhexosaminidase
MHHPLFQSKFLRIALLCVTIAGCSNVKTEQRPAVPQVANGGLRTEKPAATAIERKIDAMTLEEQVGQLIMTKIDNSIVDAPAMTLLRDQHIGGVILFTFNGTERRQVRQLTRKLQTIARSSNGAHAGLFIAADQEGGPVRIYRDLPPHQSQPADANASASEVTRHARSAARALESIGVNMTLAPVADLAVGPRRIMAGRSYGADPDHVARQVTAAVNGYAGSRVAPTVKHFPGLGAAPENTDNGVARVGLSQRDLQREMRPFAAAVNAHVPVVMVSHGIYRGFGAHLPATVASQVIDPILRGELGFDGVVITDSMNAKGMRDAFDGTVPQACVQAVINGVDVVLLTGSYETATLCRRNLGRAVRSGKLSRQRLGDALRHVLILKTSLGLLP